MKKSVSSLIAAVLTLVMVISLTAVPVLAEEAVEPECFSAELMADIDGESLSAKFTVDTLNALAALAFQMNMEGTALDLGCISNGAGIAFTSDALLDKAYGIDLTTAAENLPGSVLAPDSGSAFALDEETYAMIQQVLSGAVMDTAASAVEDASAMLTEIGARYVEVIANAVAGKIVTENGFGDVALGGENVRAMMSTMTLPAEAVADVITAVFTTAAGDEEMKALVGILLEQSGTAAEMDMTGAEYADYIWTDLEALGQELAAAAVESGAAAAVKTYTRNSELVAAALEFTADEETIALQLTIDSEAMAASIDVLFSGEEMYSIRCGVSEEPGFYITMNEYGEETLSIRGNMLTEEVGAFLGMYEYGEESVSLKLVLTEEGYELTLSDYGYPTVLAGRVYEEDGCTVITLDTIDGESLGDIRLIIDPAEEPLTMPAFTDILTLSQEEAESAVMFAMEALGAA